MHIGLSDVISFITGLFSGVSIKIAFDWSRKKQTTITQKDNVVLGDMAGRDITKHK